ncbi:MAG: methyltransferase domain-containing protein [Candidatus Shapirobacteria bacterium]|jgi:SAM-dependent methyltransferase
MYNKINTFIIRILKYLKLDLNIIYDDKFATSELRDKNWVDKFALLIIKQIDPNSVIDFGCGTGDIIKPFEKHNIKILGIDGSKSNFKYRKINSKNFKIFDLRNVYHSTSKFDLCLCLEVAEHVEEKFSTNLIQSLTESSDTIIFTAATPGQTGHDHVNLKSKKWWEQKFKNKGFHYDKKLTLNLKDKMKQINGIQYWYIDNIQIFKRK